MRFQITMNMPSRQGNLVHQIVADHKAATLQEFVDVLSDNDMVIVDEVYSDVENGVKTLKEMGPIALNPLFIGKVKVAKSY